MIKFGGLVENDLETFNQCIPYIVALYPDGSKLGKWRLAGNKIPNTHRLMEVEISFHCIIDSQYSSSSCFL